MCIRLLRWSMGSWEIYLILGWLAIAYMICTGRFRFHKCPFYIMVSHHNMLWRRCLGRSKRGNFSLCMSYPLPKSPLQRTCWAAGFEATKECFGRNIGVVAQINMILESNNIFKMSTHSLTCMMSRSKEGGILNGKIPFLFILHRYLFVWVKRDGVEWSDMFKATTI